MKRVAAAKKEMHASTVIAKRPLRRDGVKGPRDCPSIGSSPDGMAEGEEESMP